MPKSFIWLVLAVIIALAVWEMLLKDFLKKS